MCISSLFYPKNNKDWFENTIWYYKDKVLSENELREKFGVYPLYKYGCDLGGIEAYKTTTIVNGQEVAIWAAIQKGESKVKENWLYTASFKRKGEETKGK